MIHFFCVILKYFLRKLPQWFLETVFLFLFLRNIISSHLKLLCSQFQGLLWDEAHLIQWVFLGHLFKFQFFCDYIWVHDCSTFKKNNKNVTFSTKNYPAWNCFLVSNLKVFGMSMKCSIHYELLLPMSFLLVNWISGM